ncbi:hypothetical protein Afil01_11470 [Actinorhabdospora filicis]|uniref:DUF1542 domain-containing protein n=1 Tax=Actinorhabdospora filicis TaxID=1785913 RepID=A0A9W6W955_9ACTN|nr:hypothetical protein [Actinorhabdospora filicis]GLZ76340.1 hypothetical protein Afil01_11470 [Actinorhabdospora filicis]
MADYALPVAIVLVLLAVFAGFIVLGRKAAARRLADAREEALRWYERLGGQTMNLHGGDSLAAQQALVDAGERYNAAGAQLDRATTLRQYELAGQTAVEGLFYVRAAREALGMDPGPELPESRTGRLKERIEADVQGHRYTASPTPSNRTTHYYPGGYVEGRPVPSGWYSEPWWRTAAASGVGMLGAMLVFDALISPGFDSGAVEGAYADGFADGAASDGGAGGDYGGGDFGGDFGGGDFGGGGDF